MLLSIVATLYNTSGYIEEFHRRVSNAAAAITDDFEIILVDDGSPDDSLETALRLVDRDPKVKLVELARNFGHHKAMMTGLDCAKGELVFLIDSDLEEPPELLTSFFDELSQSRSDVVYGYQERRKGNGWSRYTNKLAWYLVNKLYSIKAPLNHCTVRLMRRYYVDALLLHRESNTVIGGLWVITGFRQIGLAIEKGQRAQTSYTFGARLRTFVNGLISFSTTPLLFMVYLGMLISAFSFLFFIIVILRRLLYNSAAGWASLIASIWLLGGIIILFLGVIGLYISRIFIETKRRPFSIIRQIYTRETAP
jgi:putative glycosyltransferase